LLLAHQGPGEAMTAARRQLLLRYHGAAYRYLYGVLRQTDGGAPPARTRELAEELTQEFAVRLLRGDFRGATPAAGRFRNFLKVALRNLVTDAWRQRARAPLPLPDNNPAQVTRPSDEPDLDRDFLDSWQQELLHQTWAALQQLEQQTGVPYYTLLRLKA